MVVNATPLGLRASDALPAPIDSLERGALVIDLVYSRAETPWVRAARTAGHRAVDGLGMLLEQGALAFEWWFGVPAPREVMRAAVREAVAAREDRHPRESLDRHPRQRGDPCYPGRTWIPAFAGMTGESLPACAGMTVWRR
jgi:hypothetical protein